MFPEFRSQHMLRIFQSAYCEKDFETCARFKLASASTMPERTLLPDGTHLTHPGGPPSRRRPV